MTILSELVIARHGEAACNVAGLIGGPRTCTGLTPAGWTQARQLAERLAAAHRRRPFDIVYTAPRLRVRQTATVVEDALGIAAIEEPALAGPDYGELDGRPWHEVVDAFGGPPQHDPGRPCGPGAEPWLHYLTRARQGIDALLDRNRGRRVLLIAHGETLEAAHTLLLGLPPESCRRVRFVTGHAAVTVWRQHLHRLGHETWQLVAHNDTTHLRGGDSDHSL